MNTPTLTPTPPSRSTPDCLLTLAVPKALEEEILDRGLRTIDSLDKDGDDLRDLQRQLKNLLGPSADGEAGR